MALYAFLMIADVQADGYCIELGQLEPPEKRGQVLAISQMFRLGASVFAAFIQTVLVNGPETNAPDCEVGWSSCWKFGLTVRQYYGLIFLLCAILLVPVYFLKDPEASRVPKRSYIQFIADLWDTLNSMTAYSLVLYIIGMAVMAQLANKTAMFMQYYLIHLTSSQSGIDSMGSHLATIFAVWIFKTYLINRNWRYTNYFACSVTTTFGLLWILVFYDVGGMRNAWFTIFIDLDISFVAGLAHVLFSVAIIEIAKPGQEASTFELLVSIGNSSWLISSIISTQLLVPFKATGCTSHRCSENTVNLKSIETYEDSNGPQRFTSYTLMIVALGLLGTAVFTRYLPKNRDECHVWNKSGKQSITGSIRGKVALVLATFVVSYGVIASILLLNHNTACLEFVGGSGCKK
eukprot:CAMPEP_0182419474 /NCGR_PEP_ID=MMETSP1167-20130531/3928_1 /TAXON_ID=2988 /ORGANISM="Mallomonas Sp, Strain CCMP3275" /LENGTH=404 /DNA_ID=CAMNT_0024594427 /DNA_START=611 /DNA_END=1825 /DNA_ORIENTATION=-